MRYRALFLLIVAALAFGIWAMWIADEGQGLFPRHYRPADDSAWLAKLAEPTTLIARGVPMRDLLDRLANRHGVEIQFDENALGQARVDGKLVDIPVTVDAREVSLLSAIRIVLRTAYPDWRVEVKSDSLLVTHVDAVGSRTEDFLGRAYPLGSLASAPEPIGEHEFRHLIAESLLVESWSPPNLKAEVLALPGGLALAHTLDAHLRIEELLNQLERKIDDPEDLRPVDISHVMAPGNARAVAALDRPISVEWIDVPLQEVCRRLSKMLEVPILIDSTALETTAIRGALAARPTVSSFADLPVTLVAHEQPLRDVLRWPLDVVLDESDAKSMAYVWDEAIWITWGHATPYSLRIYPVGDFPPETVSRVRDLNSSLPAPREELTGLIRSVCHSLSWTDAGGMGSAHPLGDFLVIYQRQDVHLRIEQFITQLREMLTHNGHGTNVGVSPAVRQVEAGLAQKVTFYATEQPLARVVTCLSRKCGIQIWIHERTLADEGRDTQLPTSLCAEGISLEQVLYRILKPLDLTFVVCDEGVIITSIDWAEEHLDLQMYDVRHLVDPDVGIADAEQLEDMLASLCFPGSWIDAGGRGDLAYLAGILIVEQQREGQQAVAALLDGLKYYQQHPDSTATIAVTPSHQAGIEKLAEALRQTVAFEHRETRFQRVLEDLSERYAVPITAHGRWPSAMVDICVRNISLAAALDLMLHDWRADYLLCYGQVEICDPDWGYSQFPTRIYPVRDLLYYPAAPPNPPPGPDFRAPDVEGAARATVDYDSLLDVVTSTIEPDTWMSGGGEGYADYCEGALIVSQHLRVHQRIERLLAEMRHALWQDRHPHPGPTPVDRLFERRISLNANGAPLSSFLAAMERREEIVVQYRSPGPFFRAPLGDLIWLPTPPRPLGWNEDPFADRYPRFAKLDDYVDWLLDASSDPSSPFYGPVADPDNPPSPEWTPLYPLDRWALQGLAWAGRNIHLELGPDESAVRVHRDDVPLGEALHDVVSPLGHVLCSDGEVVHVCETDDYTRPLITRVYDVRALAPPCISAPSERVRKRLYYEVLVPVVGDPAAELPSARSPLEPEDWQELPLDAYNDFASFVIFNLSDETRHRRSVIAAALSFQGLLVVRDDWQTHREITVLLAALHEAARSLPPVAQLNDGNDPDNMNRWLRELRSADQGLRRNYLTLLLLHVRPKSGLRRAILRWKTSDEPEIREAGIKLERMLVDDDSQEPVASDEATR